MKNYTITVNGNVYDVTVEEAGGSSVLTGSVPTAAPKAAAAPTAPKTSSAAAGSIRVEAGAAGKVFKLEASEGAALKKGDTILILEIMKMETPVVAPQDGTLASIEVSVGDTVESGALLATMND